MGHTLLVLRSMRPHQWVKNLFVLAPLVFAERGTEVAAIERAAIALLLFSALSGSVYLLNDLVDVESDRRHPTKRHRPIASGALPVARAGLALALILFGAVAGSFALSSEFAAIGLAYFALNVGYSFALKHVPFVDVLIIATGFILRLLGGSVAVGVELSLWLAGCTFVLALYLALGKRRHELCTAADGQAGAQRKVLDRYRLPLVERAMSVLAVATVLCYAAYTFLGHTQASFRPRDLAWTLPLVVVGVWRFDRLSRREGAGESPTDRMLRDPAFLANLLLYVLVVLGVIYLVGCAAIAPASPGRSERSPGYLEIVEARLAEHGDSGPWTLRFNPAPCSCPAFEVLLGESWHRVAFDADEEDPLMVRLAEQSALPEGRESTLWRLGGRLLLQATRCGRGALYVTLVPEEPEPSPSPEPPEASEPDASPEDSEPVPSASE